MKLIQTFLIGGILLSVGCAHSLMRGSVAMKANDSEAHVCLGDNEVKKGDKVTLYKTVCLLPKSTAGSQGGCRKEKVGEGEVERVLNEHYSIVKVDPGVPFEEGTIVEKQ